MWLLLSLYRIIEILWSFWLRHPDWKTFGQTLAKSCLSLEPDFRWFKMWRDESSRLLIAALMFWTTSACIDPRWCKIASINVSACWNTNSSCAPCTFHSPVRLCGSDSPGHREVFPQYSGRTNSRSFPQMGRLQTAYRPMLMLHGSEGTPIYGHTQACDHLSSWGLDRDCLRFRRLDRILGDNEQTSSPYHCAN